MRRKRSVVQCFLKLHHFFAVTKLGLFGQPQTAMHSHENVAIRLLKD